MVRTHFIITIFIILEIIWHIIHSQVCNHCLYLILILSSNHGICITFTEQKNILKFYFGFGFCFHFYQTSIILKVYFKCTRDLDDFFLLKCTMLQFLFTFYTQFIIFFVCAHVFDFPTLSTKYIFRAKNNVINKWNIFLWLNVTNKWFSSEWVSAYVYCQSQITSDFIDDISLFLRFFFLTSKSTLK